ncbi:MAG: ABC transporter ATP-binding protein [Euryarchaeota archaeon]|nr:ABC transporter ATP-binding protein [Euryarchaeota archaeon]
MIHLKHVETVYEGEKTPVIKDINLEIGEGEFLTVIGPNGAGKTTLLEAINGLLESKGEITVFGKNIRRYGTEIRKEVGYVPQEFSYDSLTPFLVKDVVLMGRYGKIGVLNSPSKEDRRIMEETLEFIGISKLKTRPIGKLSGGQLQKVMIARALTQNPKILLLDEPFSNLDMESRREISEKIVSLNRDGLTTIMVIHEISSIPHECNRIVKIDNSTVVMDGNRAEALR